MLPFGPVSLAGLTLIPPGLYFAWWDDPTSSGSPKEQRVWTPKSRPGVRPWQWPGGSSFCSNPWKRVSRSSVASWLAGLRTWGLSLAHSSWNSSHLFGPYCVLSMLSSFYALLEMVLRNYFYGGIHTVELSKDTLIPRVNVKHPHPAAPKTAAISEASSHTS